jgi:Rieske Fe-S protein
MPDCAKNCRRIHRRSVFTIALGGLCWAAMRPVHALAQADPASMPPQENDVLVKAGDGAATPLTVADIPRDAHYLSAWPMAPSSKVVRRGNRLNEVLLVRLDPTVLAGESLTNAADGVLAYSALCTHAGCDVSTWVPHEGILACDCHGSEFDARAAGKVSVGPASRALPSLPLKLIGELLVVAKPFATEIRFDEA